MEISRRYALNCHHSTNHLYDGKPYEVHLEQVNFYAKMFLSEIPSKDRELVISAVWLHDVIEDTRQTFNDVKAHTNKEIAEIVYALTNEKGKTRKQRANAKYYKGIKKTKYATFIKLADRIANVMYSKSKNSKMFEVYKKENDFFIKSLKKTWWEKILYKESDYKIMFKYLENILK